MITRKLMWRQVLSKTAVPFEVKSYKELSNDMLVRGTLGEDSEFGEHEILKAGDFITTFTIVNVVNSSKQQIPVFYPNHYYEVKRIAYLQGSSYAWAEVINHLGQNTWISFDETRMGGAQYFAKLIPTPAEVQRTSEEQFIENYIKFIPLVFSCFVTTANTFTPSPKEIDNVVTTCVNYYVSNMKEFPTDLNFRKKLEASFRYVIDILSSQNYLQFVTNTSMRITPQGAQYANSQFHLGAV